MSAPWVGGVSCQETLWVISILTFNLYFMKFSIAKIKKCLTPLLTMSAPWVGVGFMPRNSLGNSTSAIGALNLVWAKWASLCC